MRSDDLEIPSVEEEVVVDRYHGIDVVDPFRWLEDPSSSHTRKWMAEHSESTRIYLENLPGRAMLRSRIDKRVEPSSTESPRRVNGHVYYSKREIGEEQSKLLRRSSLNGLDEVLLDPASFKSEGDFSIVLVDVSSCGELIAFGLRTGGEGALQVRILNLKTGDILPEAMPKGALRGFGFLPDSKGFSYVLEDRERPTGPKVARRHIWGHSFKNDEVIFDGGLDPNIRLIATFDKVSGATLFTTLRALGGENLTSVYLQTGKPSECSLLALFEDSPTSWDVRLHQQYLYMYRGASEDNEPELLRTPLESPDLSRLERISIDGVRDIYTWHTYGDRLVITSVEDLASVVRVCTLEGRVLGTILLPERGTARILSGDRTGCFYSFESYARRCEVYHYDFETGQSSLFSDSSRREADCSVRRVEYASYDGKKIPLTLLGLDESFKKGVCPILLTAYGAAGASLTPQYSVITTCLVELGGIFAIAHVRGGGEYGAEWENAGKRRNRPTVHKDFLAAREFLVSSRIGAADRIAIAGGSNSGLLVGTAMTHCPDGFCAVLCIAPLLDMLRYHRFDNTQFYVPQFGTSDDPDDFPVLLNISPYHNVHDLTPYPPLLMVSGEADTRCDPMHARKFVARIQHAMESLPPRMRDERPILFDSSPLRGHFNTLPLSMRISAMVDRLAFLCHHLGIEVV